MCSWAIHCIEYRSHDHPCRRKEIPFARTVLWRIAPFVADVDNIPHSNSAVWLKLLDQVEEVCSFDLVITNIEYHHGLMWSDRLPRHHRRWETRMEMHSLRHLFDVERLNEDGLNWYENDDVDVRKLWSMMDDFQYIHNYRERFSVNDIRGDFWRALTLWHDNNISHCFHHIKMTRDNSLLDWMVSQSSKIPNEKHRAL